VVPLIATIDYGPLEVCQLPRAWLKILLKAKGLLHLDYPDMTESGLDPRVLQALKIEPSDAVAYIRENLPTYLQFEAWVLEEIRKGAPLVGTYPPNEETKARYAAFKAGKR